MDHASVASGPVGTAVVGIDDKQGEDYLDKIRSKIDTDLLA